MEGNLYKWTNYLFGWRERYFVLKGSVIYYYYKKGDKTKGRIHLGVCTINSNPNDTKIELDTGVSILYLKAETLEAKEKWLKALKAAKREFDNKTLIQGSNFTVSNPNPVNSLQINNDLNCLSKEPVNAFNNYLDSPTDRIFNNNQDIFSNKIKNISNACDRLYRNNERLGQFVTRASPDKDLSDIYSIKEIQSSSNIIKKEEDIFYGANEDGEEAEMLNQQINLYSSTNRTKGGLDLFENINGSDPKSHDLELQELHGETTSEKKIEVNLSNSLGMVKTDSPSKLSFKGKFYDPLYDSFRKDLPAKRENVSVNVWSVLRDAIGKDLSKFAVPVYFNEPMSMLQRLCENFQYTACLNRAAKEPNPCMRLCLVAAFMVGGYGQNIHRTLKFFNPLLSETYELIDNNLNFRYYAEQVSHHPPITAYMAEGEGFTLNSNSNSESKLRMTGYFEFQPTAKTFVNLTNFNEVITYTKPKSIVRNLIMGKMYIDATGKASIYNNSGDTCELDFFEKSGDAVGKITGQAKDVDGNLKFTLEGSWNSHLEVTDVENGNRERIWTRFPVPGNEEDRYFFTEFAANLNNLTEEMKTNLPPSDSRFRPDQRYLELQNIKMASEEKHRLEEKQRATRKEREKKKIKYKPIYFEETYDDLTGDLIYVYKGGYFEDRKNKNFSKFYDIY